MTSRRIDALYFILIVAVVAVGLLATRLTPDDEESAAPFTMPEFELAELELEVPFEFPYSFVRFDRAGPPRLELAPDMNGVLKGVRAALLERQVTVDVHSIETVVARGD